MTGPLPPPAARPPDGHRSVRPYGDVGYLVETSSGIEALAVAAALSASGVVARAGWRSVLVEGAPGGAPLRAVDVQDLLDAQGPPEPAAVTGRLVEVAVRYDGADLPEVAGRTGLTVAEVVARHAAPLYTVVCLGFSRGFPYLDGLDPALHLPRRASPRPRVPAGSVAIASAQAGVYPQATPGGWHLLGTTDAVLFDETHLPPALLAPGDRVRFVPVPPSPTAPAGGAP